jgi:dipicolinate synthase subunit A
VSASTSVRAAVLGGDRREVYIIRGFLAAGWEVASFGTVQEAEAASTQVSTLSDAITGAVAIVTPAPGMADDGSLYAPHAAAPVILDADMLTDASRGAHIFGGAIQPWLQSVARAAGLVIHEFADDDRLQVLHAIPTAEGAIAETVRASEDTINGATALIVGYGRIAVVLARVLRAMGADTVVAARRAEVRARALADGHRVCTTTVEELTIAAKTANLVYATAPARLIDAEVLASLPNSALVVDLASPPGGVDHDVARARGINVTWARGQAGTAPAHSGRAQFEYIAEVLNDAGVGPVLRAGLR